MESSMRFGSPMVDKIGDRHLWVLQYGSEAYNKVNLWTQFQLTRSVDPKKLREGQNLLIETQNHTPHKWTLVFSQQGNWESTFEKLKETVSGLNCSQISFFSPSDDHIFLAKNLFREEILKKKFSAYKEDSL